MATSLPYGEQHPSLCGLAPGCVSLIFHMTGQLEGTGIQRHLCKRGQLAMKEHDSLRPKEPQNVTSMLDECDCADCVVFSVSNAGLSSKPGWGSFRRKWQGILLRYTPCNTKGGNTVPVISSSVEDLTKPSRPNLLHSPLPLTAAGSKRLFAQCRAMSRLCAGRMQAAGNVYRCNSVPSGLMQEHCIQHL